jgi:hypothetical protein
MAFAVLPTLGAAILLAVARVYFKNKDMK